MTAREAIYGDQRHLAACAWQEFFFFLGRDCWGLTEGQQKRHIAALTHVARMERVCPLLITPERE